MAVTTIDGHVSRALDFFNKDSIHFAIGRTSSWENEFNPPTPLPTDEMEDPLGYKQVESKFMVVPDENGSITYRNEKWRIVDKNEALDNGSKWVYLATYVAYDELPTNVSYRQIGVYTGLKRNSGVPEGKYNLLPTDVQDPGILEVLDNRTPVYRESDQREQLILILEF